MDANQANQNANAPPGTIHLGGKMFLVGQPTDSDMGAIGSYLKKHAKSHVAALQGDPDFALLPVEMQKEKLAGAAVKKFDSSMPFDPQSALEALTSLEGVRFIAWVLIRKKHPEMSFEEISALITPENHLHVSVELDLASGMASLGNSAGRPGSAGN